MSLCRPLVSRDNGGLVRAEWRSRYYNCPLCNSCCDSGWTLAKHLLGPKHKPQSPETQEQNDGICLSYFLKAHMKEDLIVGLEYVMEVKKDSSYSYSCRLCKVVNTDLPTILHHITNPLHTERYIIEHFIYLLPPSKVTVRRRQYVRGLRDVAATILEQQGNRKEIQVVLLESDGKTQGAIKDTPPSKPKRDGKTRGAIKNTPPSKPKRDGKTRGAIKNTPPSKPKSGGKTRGAIKDIPPSKRKSGNCSHSKLSQFPYQKTGLNESREIYRYNKMLQISIRNDPPLAKRSRRCPEGDRGALPSTPHISMHRSSHYKESHAVRMDCTAAPELEFRTNDEFLEYLANFVVAGDEDVLFIRKITQNCMKALKSFQEEDAERQKTGHQPVAPLEDTSRTAHKIPRILEDETESHLSDSRTTLLKVDSNPPSDSIPKNEATALFFNSIKDMDESEMVGVFQKIAATNPEFQEMDIPTVVRFLKDCSRFKKP